MRRLSTSGLTGAETAAIRDLLWAAFDSADEDERFTEADWDHALGGTHFVLDLEGTVIAHAAVVERELHLDGRALRTGYVEAVATAPARQGAGFGSTLLEAVNEHIRTSYELGALGSGRHHFYERLGWRTWRGPSGVRTVDGLQRTPDDDGFLLVLETPSSPPLDLTASISCDWRPGDVW